ncbi:MAG: HAMP domain-containing histidine kinase [Acetatifactor sp.]|nr:HAMP domain-containing histidine kinase [Acetatifactor sp.]
MNGRREKTAKDRLPVVLWRYLTFFSVIAFAITGCMIVFLKLIEQDLGVVYTESNISHAAILTFINVILISIFFTVIDAIRRKFMVERPVRRIVSAAEKIMCGEFSVRIEPLPGVYDAAGFNVIIEYFNKMADELSGTETLRTDFIANVSHELKTPLAVMQNYGTMLQSPNLPDERRQEYAKAITESSRRLADLITNILKLNKLENQQIYPHWQTYNLGEQLCECLLNFESIWEKKEIEIDTDIEEEVFIDSDEELLTLAWNNLFSNAMKFTERGGRVSVSLKSDGGFAVVQVSDTGCGISPEVGRHIFEKFYQGDTSHSTQGNGLGLALVKRIIDIVDGDITVQSEVGKGSTFTVRIRRNGNGTA